MITSKDLNSALKKLHNHLKQSGRTRLVLGISGGVDSAATLGMLLKLQEKSPNTYEIVPVSCPIYDSDGTTEQLEAQSLANRLCYHYNIELRTINLQCMAQQAATTLKADTPYLAQQVDYWLRPMAFYKVSMESPNSILVGTINKSEWDLGWFSQYLDVLGVNPIIDLYKSEVYQLATLVDVPSFITEVPPKGGLADSKTDEESLGFTYQQYEDYVLKGIVEEPIKDLIRDRILTSEFKRNRFNEQFVEGFFK